MKNKIFSLVLALSSTSFLFACAKNEKQIADKIIYGNIYTANESGDKVDAIAIKDGKILFAGNKKNVKSFIGKQTEIETYNDEELITPGLVDAHSHVTQMLVAKANKLGSISNGASKAQCIQEIREYVENNSSKDFYTLSGWEMQNFASEEYGCPTAEMIDDITTKPIVCFSSDGHSYWVNTATMTLAGITKDTETPVGGEIVKDNEGNPLGVFKDTAQYLIDTIRPDIPKKAYEEGIKATDDMWLGQGYVTRFDALGNLKANPNKYPLITNMEEADKAGNMLTYCQSSFVINNSDDALEMVDSAISLRDSTKGGNFEVTNVKLFLDGIIENSGAYFSEPYLEELTSKDYYGTPLWPTDEDISKMGAVIAKANLNDMPCHFHCMGDQAVSDALTAIEIAAGIIGKDKVKEQRNTITHLALVNENDYARFADLNVVAALNPWTCKDPGYYENLQVKLLGRERAEKQYPAKSFLNNNIKISFGTDMGASFTFNSIECFHALTTRLYNNDDPNTLLWAEEKLSREEMLKAMTIGGAYQLHRENKFGSLEVGKDASLCLFSKDLLEIPDGEIMSTVVEKTMVMGTWISQ